MADETLLLQLDIGGDSGDAVSAASDVASAFEGLQGQLDAVNEGAAAVGDGSAAAASGLEETATAADSAATATADAATAASDAGIGFGDLGSALSGLGGTLGGLDGQIGQTVNLTRDLGSSLMETAGATGEGSAAMIGALGGVATAGAAAFIGLGVMGADWATQIMQLSAVTGMSAEETERWSLALENVGAGASSLQRLALSLNPTIQNGADAMRGLATETAKTKVLTEDLGVAVVDSQGNMRSMNDVLDDTIAALGNIEDPTLRSAYASELFGRRVAANVLILATHQEALRAADAQMKEWGPDVNQAADQAIKYHTAMTGLKEATEGIASQVLPAFTSALTAASNAVGIATTATAKLKGEMDNLPGPLAKVVSGASQLTTTTGLVQLVYGDLVPKLKETADGLLGTADAQKENTDAAQAAIPAAENVSQSLKQWQDDLKAVTDSFTQATNAMSGLFHAPTQEELRANALLAQRREELGELKLKGDATTEADRARIDQLQNQEIPIIQIAIQRQKDHWAAVEATTQANWNLAPSEAQKARMIDEGTAAIERQSEGVSRFINKLEMFTIEARQQGADLGHAVGEGMAWGIDDSQAFINAAAVRAMAAANAAARNQLGASSPSKVFMELGGDTMEGYALGIEAMLGRVEGAFRNTFDLVPEMAPAAARPSPLPPATLALQTPAAGTYTTINVYADRYVGNHQEFAEEIMQAYVRLQRQGRIA